MTKSINLDRQCIVCGSTKLSKVSLGNYFLSQYFTPSKPQPSHNLNHFSYTLAQCSDCHHIQNTNLHPSLTNITTSDFKKLDFELRAKSVEPEDHFDPLLVWLSQFVDFNKSLRSIGTTYKDITLIQKINQLILGNNLPVKVDLLSSHDDTLEFTYELLKSNYNLTRLSGKYDFIAARHILEHVPNPLQFIRRMLGHINDKGILYLELPSPKYLANHGYAAQAWEEHCSYFTTKSLLKMASQMQLQCEIVFFENGCEPLLCAVLKKSNNLKSNLENLFASPIENIDIKNLPLMLDAAKNKLNHIAANTRKNSTYFFGAGHIGIKHVNFLCINDIIDAIIDDNPRKNGLYSGSANLPVIDKDTALQEEECLIIHPFENEKFGKICSSDSRIMRHQILSIDSLFR